MYKLTRIISGKYRGASDVPIENKQGKLLTTETDQEARWAEHFSEVLNRPPTITPLDFQDTEAKPMLRLNHRASVKL